MFVLGVMTHTKGTRVEAIILLYQRIS